MIGSLRSLVWRLTSPDPATAGELIRALRDCGWVRSRRENRSVDVNGQPIPWMTYPAIEFLTRRVRNDLTVFEYGCGASTLWWAARVARIVSVEHDPGWVRHMSAQLPPNATIVHVPLDAAGRYASNATAHGTRFDIVVVDGRDRVRCALSAIEAVAEDGVIVFDDTNRGKYEQAYRALATAGFRSIEFFGLAPIGEDMSETSIFYRTPNCLGI